MPGPAEPIIEALGRGATVVTATERLTRELIQNFDRHQLQQHKQAWESADVIPYNAWLRRSWQWLSARDKSCPVLLNDLHLSALWEGIIRKDIESLHSRTGPLWNTPATARAAIEAWRILYTWNISLEDCTGSWHEDHRCFIRWARQFQKICQSGRWIDSFRLPGVLVQTLDGQTSQRLPELSTGNFLFAGFDRITPQHQLLKDALTRSGAVIEVCSPTDPVNRKIDVYDYPDDPAQWLAAARWARAKLACDPQAKLAIVAPDLNRVGQAVDYALKLVLAPDQLMHGGNSADLPYHVSLGRKLAEYPAVKAALIMLMPFNGNPIPFQSISQLILSPFVRGASSESMARSKLELWCRRRLPYQIYFEQFLRELPDPTSTESRSQGPGCPQFHQAITNSLALLEERRRQKPVSFWMERFDQWLDILGWPGDQTLSSDEYQVVQAFRKQLKYLASLDLTLPSCDAAVALGWLQRRLTQQNFQVEAGEKPVQVLGVLEMAGLQFDATWFGGLTENDWPPPQQQNPFVPLKVQRNAGVHQSSIELNRAFARTLQNRLIRSSPEIVLSRPRRDKDISLQPSSLLSACEPAASVFATVVEDVTSEYLKITDVTINNPTVSFRSFTNRHGTVTPAEIIHAAKPELDQFVDKQGLVLNPAQPVRGGIAIIADQAKCPFRAYANHRLHAKQIDSNEQGLSAPERGSLIHQALQLVWQQLQNSAKLQTIPDEELKRIITTAVTGSVRRFKFSSGLGDQFATAQTEWLVVTLTEWLQAEKHRRLPFAVEQLEKETTLNLNGLLLTFKIDRIDRFADGSLAVIDYKSGAPERLEHWIGERPESPQLPLYSIAQGQGVSAITFGQVKRGSCHFRGISREQDFDQGKQSPNKVYPLQNTRNLKDQFERWDDLFDHWQQTLPDIAERFVDGKAEVDPLNEVVCRHCNLHNLCRIGDTGPDAGVEQ